LKQSYAEHLLKRISSSRSIPMRNGYKRREKETRVHNNLLTKSRTVEYRTK
jgi:hypothetical protein